jgi:E3 ubiquitin-protein ligase HUWE1
LSLARLGTVDILTLYSRLVHGKNVTEANQTLTLANRSERERDRADYFLPAQFLVELRIVGL